MEGCILDTMADRGVFARLVTSGEIFHEASAEVHGSVKAVRKGSQDEGCRDIIG